MMTPLRIRAAQLTRREFIQGMIAGSLLLPRWSAFALPEPRQFPFEEVPPEKSGIRWVHTSGKSPEKYLPESSGSRLRIPRLRQRWLDGYLPCEQREVRFLYAQNPPLRNALYKNNRDGTFTDVTERAGVAGGGYGQGVAVGDYDGDGFPDIYVTQYGRSILYHNNRRRHVHGCYRKGGSSCAGVGFERGLVRL